MRLSEALMVGSTLGEKVSNRSWNKCLLGIACHALGEMNFRGEGVRRWPWLLGEVGHSEIACGIPMSGSIFITRLAARVESGEMTIQRAAEIVREIEPDEPLSQKKKFWFREKGPRALPQKRRCRE